MAFVHGGLGERVDESGAASLPIRCRDINVRGMVVARIETDDYLTTEEAGQVLGLSTDSVRRYCNNAMSDDPSVRPKLEGISVGRSWLIHRKEIERYQKERNTKGRPSKAPAAS